MLLSEMIKLFQKNLEKDGDGEVVFSTTDKSGVGSIVVPIRMVQDRDWLIRIDYGGINSNPRDWARKERSS